MYCSTKVQHSPATFRQRRGSSFASRYLRDPQDQQQIKPYKTNKRQQWSTVCLQKTQNVDFRWCDFMASLRSQPQSECRIASPLLLPSASKQLQNGVHCITRLGSDLRWFVQSKVKGHSYRVSTLCSCEVLDQIYRSGHICNMLNNHSYIPRTAILQNESIINNNWTTQDKHWN